MIITRAKVLVAASAATIAAFAVTLLLVLVPTTHRPDAATSTAGTERPTDITNLTVSPVEEELDRPLPAAKPVRVDIPDIGVHTGEIAELGLMPDGALEVPRDATTAGWYAHGPTPGERGPAVLAGHVDYNHVPGVFLRLRHLRAGSEATVHRADGTSAVFTIDRVEHYPKSAFPTESVYGNTRDPQLRLITCGGAFDRASGQYRDNIVAYARLVRVGTS